MTLDRLDLYLHDEHVATAVDAGQGLASIQYTEDVVIAYGIGSTLLSVALPVRSERYPAYEARAFLDGLLPEGSVRDALARQLRKRPEDTFELLAEVGRECAGAVVIVRAGATPSAGEGEIEILDDSGLAQRLAELPTAPLGIKRTGNVRLSLAGAEEKLAVVRLEDRRFGLPLDATPTTHILKPSNDRFPGLAINEATCLTIARQAGLFVPASELVRVEGLDVLVVERFDRTPSGEGVRRRHQEDFVQALSRREKYEGEGGPTLVDMAAVLAAHSAAPVRDLPALAGAVTTNVLLSNADAHAKNYSIHLEPAVRLTPFYDLVCTGLYDTVDTELALRIGGVRETNEVRASHLVSEFSEWGIAPPVARQVVSDRVGAIAAAAEDVEEQGTFGETGRAIAAIVRRNALRLQAEDGTT